MAKGKAWAALRKLSYVWKAPIPAESKRSLFLALIEPILSYPMCAYTLDARTTEKLDSAYSAMLRYALGLKCAYISREFMHTEELFAALPFLSTQLRVRRMSFLAHLCREHFEGRRYHPMITALFWDFSDFKKGKARYSLREDILYDARVQYPQQLFEIFMSRAKCKKLLQQLARNSQVERWSIIHKRRARLATATS